MQHPSYGRRSHRISREQCPIDCICAGRCPGEGRHDDIVESDAEGTSAASRDSIWVEPEFSNIGSSSVEADKVLGYTRRVCSSRIAVQKDPANIVLAQHLVIWNV